MHRDIYRNYLAGNKIAMRFCILLDIKTPILPIFSYFGWSISRCIK